MLSLIFALLANIAPASQSCETFAPNLDGIAVTVCEGSVVARTDAMGVTHYSFNDNIDAF